MVKEKIGTNPAQKEHLNPILSGEPTIDSSHPEKSFPDEN
jgi:hypothetical protein